MNLRENTILITGGSRGIGFEMAKNFADLDNTVIITGRDTKTLKIAADYSKNITAIKSDVTKYSDIEKLYTKIKKEFPKLNVLINNAGTMRVINLHNSEFKKENLTGEIDINVKGPIFMVDKFLPLLKKNGSAAIVNVSSGLAFIPLPISPVYCATKAALHSYTISLRVQLANTNVKVFELAPPATATELLDHMDPDDMKGISIMTVEKMIAAFLRGFKSNEQEICPGQASQLRFAGKFMFNFVLKQMSKPVKRLLQQ